MQARIDKHMSIAMALLEKIKERQLDVFFELEEKIKGRAALEKPMLHYMTDDRFGAAADKLRLLLVYCLCSPSEGLPGDVDDIVAALEGAGLPTSSLAYVRRWKSMLKMTQEYTGGVANTVSMFSKLVNQGSSLVVEGVKNFVLKVSFGV